jgi:hypothetical protein
LEVTVATTKRDLAVAKKKLVDTMSAVPYNIQAEMDAYQAVKALEDGLAYAQDVLASRFN